MTRGPGLVSALTGQSPSRRGGLFPIDLEARVDQGDLGVDRRMAQAFLLGDQLHQPVGTFDVRRAVLQRARRPLTIA